MIQNCIKIGFVCTVLILSLHAQAQDISTQTIKWKSDGFVDLSTNENVTSACEFVTYGFEKIKWIQNGGNFVNELTVTNTNGTWTNINSEGSIKLQFEDSKYSLAGNLTISRVADGWILDLSIPNATAEVKLRYHINSFELL